MTKSNQTYPTDLNDTQWSKIRPYLPAAASTGRPREHGWRVILNGIFYILQSGCSWRMLSSDLPPWQTVYHYFRWWRKDGFWERLNQALREKVRRQRHKKKPQPSATVLDSQSIKTSEGGLACGYDAGKKITGRKRHALVDTLGLLVKVVVTAADVQDRDGAKLLLEDLTEHKELIRRLKRIWADEGYRGALVTWVEEVLGLWDFRWKSPDLGVWRVRSTRHTPKSGNLHANSQRAEVLGWKLEIIEKPKGQVGFQVLPKRWVVERTFAWLVRQRRLARDYERLPETSEAFIYAAMIRLMIRRLADP